MDDIPAEAAHKFEHDLGLVQKAISTRVTPKYTKMKDTHWRLWNDYCVLHRLDAFLRGTNDAVPYITVYGALYSDGTIAPPR